MGNGNEAKVRYILGLLGRKRNSITNVLEQSARLEGEDSSFIDTDGDTETEEETELIETDSDRSSLYDDIVSISSSTTQIKEVLMSKILQPSAFQPRLPIISDNYISETTETQDTTEIEILQEYKNVGELNFLADVHEQYVLNSMNRKLPPGYNVLEASHPWMIFWLTNSYSMMENEKGELNLETVQLINKKIETCIVDGGRGGIAGGANQLGHVAATYAAILSLVLTRNYTLLDKIRYNLHDWYMSLKRSDGSFSMHKNGESDTRSTYCVLVVCSLLNTVTPELTRGVVSWLQKTQTYEGGFAGVPNTEAHGGYTFCAIASYFLLYTQKSDFLNADSFNLQSFTRWLVFRQAQVEGSLSGRTNKLVDACYSFWIGGCFPLIEAVSPQGGPLFDRDGLLNYILRCAQSTSGGFRDKPGKSVDFYHTNYTLCGLSICERMYEIEEKTETPLAYQLKTIASEQPSNKHTRPVHPVFGISIDAVKHCHDHFNKRSSIP